MLFEELTIEDYKRIAYKDGKADGIEEGIEKGLHNPKIAAGQKLSMLDLGLKGSGVVRDGKGKSSYILPHRMKETQNPCGERQQHR